MQSCIESVAPFLSPVKEGAEILHMSNPGDYDYDEETFEESEYEIIEVE